MSVLVIIPAAGSGSRFGGPVPKQFQPLAGKPLVQYVIDRSNLVAAQTPQCFRYDILRDALARAEREKFDATDEAGLAAHYGYQVHIVPGDPFNIKITRPEDLALAEAHFEEWSK